MTLDEIAAALFRDAPAMTPDASGVIACHAVTRAGTETAVIGITGGKPVGIEAALALARHVLDAIRRQDGAPILVLVDTQSQEMTRRDELLGLSEALSHLCKCLALASLGGRRTIGLLYGRAAAGAFIATALSTDTLIALDGAEPSVMDLPSIARITKLPLERLQEMAGTTPIFAPGVSHLAETGAVAETWRDPSRYADDLDRLLEAGPPAQDPRAALGRERGGRRDAERIIDRVLREARAGAA